ncbi:hypothetical protein HGRIS_008381 [Hohenbuehelia grisea]|uniref:Uncharacterized protein n=1 Tax=Hohenbuehelia grisea TaxID=104357 RepID=A0ABR3J7S9_9AGAR
MSMTCCSSCVSGFAAAVALIAFIFDLALFFIAKSRINAVPGGSAQIGNAIWLTLAAWLLLFFSGCFYTLGRCCISKRGKRSGDGGKGWSGNKDHETGGDTSHNKYAEQMRLDAVKAEADRKARQKEAGLPAFYENKPSSPTYETLPLTARVDGDSVYTEPYRDSAPPPAPAGPRRQGSGYAAGGYAQAPAGTRAVDEYYNPSQTYNNTPSTTYPPQPQSAQQQPRRQQSGYAASTYAPSTYTYNGAQATSLPTSGNQYGQYGTPQTTSPPPMPTIGAAYGQGYSTPPATTPSPANNQYLNAGNQYGQDPYGASPYGHTAGGTSYHSASSHQQYPSAYAQAGQEPAFNADPYNATAAPYAATSYEPQSYYSPQQSTPGVAAPQPQPHERAYTLGGDGYGANSVPPLNDQAAYNPYMGTGHGSPAPINTNVGVATTSHMSPHNASPVKGPTANSQYEDSPPGYDAGNGQVTGAWGKH